VQRIFNGDKIQDTVLTADKVLNVDHYSASSYARVTNFRKWSDFYGPPCI